MTHAAQAYAWHRAAQARIVAAFPAQIPMATPKPFLHNRFLRELEQFATDEVAPASWPPSLLATLLIGGDQTRPSPAARHLIPLLHARQAMLKAAFDTEQVADALRRYQKFAKPGQPSPHIVQLRQQQAAVRQASSQSRQLLVQSAAAFVRETGIKPPSRVALEPFIVGWMESCLPAEPADTTGNSAA